MIKAKVYKKKKKKEKKKTKTKKQTFAILIFTSYLTLGTAKEEGRTHKRSTLMDPHTWPCKSRTTSTNIHSAAM